MAPVISGLKETSFEIEILNTGQHGDLMRSVIETFGLEIDYELNVMRKKSNLSGLTERIMVGASDIMRNARPDMVLVHGDTTTCLSVALCSLYEKIPLAHVEAGLRSGDLNSPWPEEANRRLTDAISSIHFAPTEIAKTNLLKENIDAQSIHVTGNTGIDAFLKAHNMIESNFSTKNRLRLKHNYLRDDAYNILVTVHRRENIGNNLREICKAIRIIKDCNPNVSFVVTVHPNPGVTEIIGQELTGVDGIKLIPPQDYLDFIYLLENSYMLLTDSGGVQEEAPSISKPVLVLRDTTERPEGIASGCAVLVGTKQTEIVRLVQEFLDDKEKYQLACSSINPYGDGKASDRIKNVICEYMNESGL